MFFVSGSLFCNTPQNHPFPYLQFLLCQASSLHLKRSEIEFTVPNLRIPEPIPRTIGRGQQQHLERSDSDSYRNPYRSR
jgi:hypothetical protein